MRPRLPATALAILLAVGLSSCTGDPDPIIEPTPAPTTAPSETPTPAPTPSPEPQQESAKDFIRRWQSEAVTMQLTGDSSEYLEMTRNCESCEALSASVAEIYGAGGSISGVAGTVEGLSRVGSSEGILIFEYVLRSRPSRVLDADGNVTRRFTGGTNRYQVNVERGAGNWFVRSASRLSA